MATEALPDSDALRPPDAPSEWIRRSLLHHQRLDEPAARSPAEGAMTHNDRQFGSGWISGAISTTLGAMGFGGVLCLLFPSLLTSPQLRAIYPMNLVRGLIHFTLLGAFFLGVLSVILRRNKVLGCVGIGFSLLAAALGGSRVAIEGPVSSATYVGLDWFLLDLLLMALIFVPLERLFARLREQDIFRPGWITDLAYFGTSHL